MAPVRLLSYFPSIALAHLEGFLTAVAACCVVINTDGLQVACCMHAWLRWRRSTCKVVERSPVFWVTPLHDHHPVLNGPRTTAVRRTAPAVVVQVMSSPCLGPFTSNLSDLACNVAAFLAAVAFEYLQLIGDVRPEEQAWVQT